MDYKLIVGIGFICAGCVVVAISQFFTIGQILRFPMGP